jgi:hypothetical protein
MDIQQQVAARRVQLAQQQEDQKAADAAERAAREAERQQQEREALDTIARDKGLVVEGDEMLLPQQPIPPLDVEGLKQSKLDALLKREARKRWTAGENWQVIGSIVGGICLIHLGGLGFVPLLFGLWRRSAINRKHRSAVRADYPAIFA